ncbi:hypothetical protein GM3708_1713 [Geminocystis sp. NIES-3708]|uniref:YwqG family protein n=1 Tax=Geminocystis sp. NIES-3708 TaxID=1615909 RepID=UPI0005FCD4A0|nr:YwqG family protein [Geminocystis sp. NIES-3708]BAQ61307.1 hypothetical protein GM3708_1713 [Geminocystis sp. NIES-3708]
MSNSLLFDLPQELQPFHQVIENTLLDYLQIKITPITVNNKINTSTLLWKNKFGGLPYLPKNQQYPINDKGEYLRLVAQLNFSEIPNLNNFPKSGILQFFIDRNDDIYGLDFDNQISQKGFRILYYPEIDKNSNNLITDFSFLGNLAEDHYFPIRGEFALEFTLDQAPICPDDQYFNYYLPELNRENNGLLFDIYAEYYENKFSGIKHQLGGYPYFTQSDPRFGISKENEPYQLLLQIDSEYFDDGFDICWGDVGIANFFIQPSALKKLDFSQVLYNWDCT